uniref:Uncharacterized protein n=1 Tax=Brassica oleracea var. oleracea TaxID=109376 RepID=A0A0D3AS16_BRAOL
MDLSEERKHSKRQKDYINMLSYTCDSEYGIPRRCSCGGRIIDEEQIESLTKRLEEAEEVMKFVPSLKNQIETLEAQAKGLTRQVDRLTAEVYNLTVQVADLEKLCFE